MSDQRGPTPVRIMAVPFITERVRNAKRLADATGGVIVFDQVRDIMDTFCLVLASVGPDEPVIVLQDDVYLHPRWRELVEEAISEHPDSVIQFFSLRTGDVGAEPRWQPGSAWLAHPCFYLPAGYAEPLRQFARQFMEDNPGHTGDDTCLQRWLVSRRERYWHYAPSLVQHHVWRSAVNDRRSSKRQSPSFEGDKQ